MKVSVIIPCYNVEGYIEECAESVMAQTQPVAEIICVDNNSTDGTFQRLHELASRYALVQVADEPKKGACAARNTGMRRATGEWLQFLDADDLLKADKIKHQLELIGNDQAIHAVAAAYTKTGSGVSVKRLPESDPWKGVFTTQLGITSANLFKRQAVLDIGGWDESLQSSQEYDLMFRLMANGAMVALDKESHTEIRSREGGQISTTNQESNWKQYVSLRLRMIEHLKKEHSDYFVSNHRFYFQRLFESLRSLSLFDLDHAAQVYADAFPEKWSPEASESISRSYLIMLRLFGFRGAQRLIDTIKGR